MAQSLAPAGSGYGDRRSRYATVATELSLLSDRRLADLVAGAEPAGAGIGGTTARLVVAGVPVFVKRVPLTDLELRPEHVRSTANLFDLPTFYHYGIGSAGSGAWRELAAHLMTTHWVLAGQCPNFPLLYHWRVLAGEPAPRPTPAQRTELDRQVRFWEGDPAVRVRLEALAAASAGLLLFSEYLPDNLYHWLPAQVATGTGALAAACAMVERDLRTAVPFMNAHGLLHFDAHFGNILTDGERLYLSDFGLATSTRFDLSPAERDFLERNRDHDGCYTVTGLVNRLVTALTGVAEAGQRNDIVRRWADGEPTPTVAAPAAAIIQRYAPVAVAVNDFYWTLFGHSRATPYPSEQIARACARAGFQPAVPAA